jgi:N-methylhydantoinase A
MTWTVGVDVGGTFTDFFALNESTGYVHVTKRPSTPDNPARAVLDGLGDLSDRHNLPLNELRHLSHGTTVATNALIQRRGGKVMMLTTSGFGDLLEIGRQTRPHMYDLQKDHPPPLVGPDWRIEVKERITAGGEVITTLTEEVIDEAVTAVKNTKSDACAICFLFAFQNSEHEKRLETAVKRALPQLYISRSSDVQPEFREVERFSTTVLNAYLQPVMAKYIDDLESGLIEKAPNATLGLNQSSGGLMSLNRARNLPIRTALSGPAAGVVGAAHVAKLGSQKDVITLDMGGTSADVALIRKGAVPVAFGRDVSGLPIRMPMIDVETVGAGGGSVAWIDRDGLLKVGPSSTGADPGPACYNLGGMQPTVTDANLLLGRLSESGLLGGSMPLNMQRAREAFQSLSDNLSIPIQQVARGVIDIVVSNMVRAIRTISVERGYDPRGYCLMPFGGAGPLHARDVAHNLGIERILVPPTPGIVCAHGLVVSDLKEDFVIGERIRVVAETLDSVRNIVSTLVAKAQNWYTTESILPETQQIEIRLDMRYVGQNFELAVPLSEGTDLSVVTLDDSETLIKKFFQIHEANYGYFNPKDPVEIINFRLTARGRIYPLISFQHLSTNTVSTKKPAVRDVMFNSDSPITCSVYQREIMTPGQSVRGPAVFEQLDATTIIYPDDIAEIDTEGNLLITLGNVSS